MRANEFRDLSAEELKYKESDLRDELFKLRYQHASGQLENTARLGVVKKDIARLLTVCKERINAKTDVAKEDLQ